MLLKSGVITKGLVDVPLIIGELNRNMSTLPDFKRGIDYWTGVDATVDGVLGGFGEGVSRQPPRPRRLTET